MLVEPHCIVTADNGVDIDTPDENGDLVSTHYAKGEYVWFVDSDDWIEENCLARIIPMLTDNVDMLQLSFRYVYEDGSPSKDVKTKRFEGIKTGKEVTLSGGLIAPAQFTIYRKDFLFSNHLEFVRGIYHEDSEFKPRATLLAKKVEALLLSFLLREQKIFCL